MCRACQPPHREGTRPPAPPNNERDSIMSAAIQPHPHVGETVNYLNDGYGWKSWLLTTDHKRIALLYLFSITAFFFVGGAFAVAMRVNLLSPDGVFPHDTY